MAYKAGITPERFWQLTPYVTRLLIRAWHEMEVDRFNQGLSLAWHTAAFGRTEKLPKLQSIMIQQKNKKPETRAEKIARFRAFFGTVKGAEATNG